MSVKQIVVKNKKQNPIKNWIRRRSFVRGIQSLIAWFVIIWQDRQWDYGFVFILLEKKLTLMEKHWESENLCNYVGEERDLSYIKVAKGACKRLIKDDYWKSRDFTEEAQLKQKDLDLLCDTLKNHLFDWWD